MKNRLYALRDALPSALAQPLIRVSGTVTGVSPSSIRVSGISEFCTLGTLLHIDTEDGVADARVVAITGTETVARLFSNHARVRAGSSVRVGKAMEIFPDVSWKGRAVDALGQPLDGLPLPTGPAEYALEALPPVPLRRAKAENPLKTGVRAIDVFAPLCFGQRIGLFAGAGVGKSTLLSMLAQSSSFDVTVVALIGERGREVRETLDALAAQGNMPIAVVSTGDESPLLRTFAPKTAMAIAEYFRDRGSNVLLAVDSLTRFAHSARDVAMSAGELPVARGYPPSVFTELPQLLERAGPGLDGSGTITAFFSVLVDGDDVNEPVADAVRGLLDGHIVLSRSIAELGRYPAVDILASISRLSQHAWTEEERQLATRWKAECALYEETKDLRMLGGYKSGSDEALDRCVAIVPKIYDALNQPAGAPPDPDPFKTVLGRIAG
jgi:flagellum-specific ATP synthase